jgi:hypothetical protein
VLTYSFPEGDFSEQKMKYQILFVCSVMFFARCGTRNMSDLLGTWKVDSVYSYYNGFSMISASQEPLYHFQEDGQLRMTQNNEFRNFVYHVQGDSLTYSTLDDKRVDGLLILTLNDQHLVLKKTKSHLFKGVNQERYEVKYFSKIN